MKTQCAQLNYCDTIHTMMMLANIIYCMKSTLGVCQPGTIQLVSGHSEGTGLVQVCLDGSWTYVCGSGWSSVDAGVICRQLGYSFYGKFQVIFQGCRQLS